MIQRIALIALLSAFSSVATAESFRYACENREGVTAELAVEDNLIWRDTVSFVRAEHVDDFVITGQEKREHLAGSEFYKLFVPTSPFFSTNSASSIDIELSLLMGKMSGRLLVDGANEFVCLFVSN